MTLIERYKNSMQDLQNRKNVLFTPEILASKTYKDMHINKEALDPDQSRFLKIVEKYNDDCLNTPDEKYYTDEKAVDEKIAELEKVLKVIADTIYTIKWEKYENQYLARTFNESFWLVFYIENATS